MLTNRSQQKELIDLGSDFYTSAEYNDCLRKLFRVNKVFGIFYSTRQLLRQFSRTSTVLDVGCGGGLFLLNLSKHFPAMKMLGIDINPDAIQQAQQALVLWQQRQSGLQVSFQLQTTPTLTQVNSDIDILLVTLVCHHLSDEELIEFLQQAYQNARVAVVINDLHRHKLSQWLYKCVSPLLFGNRLITHDGLISIERGFTRAEWVLLLQKANIGSYQSKWCFPFRWQIILRK